VITDTKQVIVVRSDLNMRKGKIGAQVGHAVMGFITSQYPYEIKFNSIETGWFETGTKKIVVQIPSLDELYEIVHKAKCLGIKTYTVLDSGLTEFKEPTITCVALGPDMSDKIDLITKELKLY
jgi:peptidyl-tRNA hydrolase, PTH2 family